MLKKIIRYGFLIILLLATVIFILFYLMVNSEPRIVRRQGKLCF